MTTETDRLRALLDDPGTGAGPITEQIAQLVASGAASGLAETLDAIEENGGRWQALAEALERESEGVTELRVRSGLLLAAGVVWERGVARMEQAVASYQAAFRLAGDNVAALRRARGIYERVDNQPLVGRLLQMELAATRAPDARAAVLVELALWSRRRGDDRDVVEGWLRKAVEADPTNETALALLHGGASPGVEVRERALRSALGNAQGSERARLLVALARLLRDEGGAAADVVAALLSEAAEADPTSVAAQRERSRAVAATGDLEALGESVDAVVALSEDRAEKADALVRLAEARLGGGDVDGADVAAERALDEVAGLPRALVVLARVAQRRSDWSGAVDALERAMESGGDAAIDIGLAREAAILAWRYLADLDRAEPFFRRVRSVEPRDGSALRFYAEYWAGRDARRHLAALRALAEVVGADEQGRLLVDVARATDAIGDDAGASIDAWSAVIARDAGDLEAQRALRERLREAGRWNRLVDLLREDVEALDPGADADRTRLLEEIASIWSEALKVPARAVAAWGAVLESDPSNEPAFAALSTLYRDSARFTDLARLLEARAAVESDPERARLLLLDASEVWSSEVGNPSLALQPLWVLADRDPADLEVAALEARCHRATGDWEAVVRALMRAEAGEGDEATEMVREAADVAVEHLEPAMQLAPLRALLRRAPGEEATRALVRAARGAGQPRAALEALRARASQPAAMPTDLARELVNLLRETEADPDEIALAADRLIAVSESSEEQLAALEVRRSARPDDTETAEQLAELRLQCGDRRGAIEVWSELVERADPSDAALYLQRLVDICAAEPAGLVEAFRWASELFEREPSFANLEQADALATRTHREEEWIDGLRLAAALDTCGDDVRVAALRRAATLLAGRTGRESEAIVLLEQVVAIDPDDLATRRRLVSLCATVGVWERWAEAAEALVARDDDASARARLLGELADRYERELHDPEAAIAARVRSIEAGTPAAEQLDDLERLARATGRWGLLAGVYEELVQGRHVGESATHWRLRLAEIYRHELGDAEEAVHQLRSVLDDEPGHDEALVELDSLLLDAGRWDELVDVIEERALRAETPEDVVAQLNRLVVIHEHQRADRAAAAGAASRLVDAAPFDVDARETLIRLLAEAGDFRGVAARLAAEIGLEDAGESVPDARLRYAEVLADELGESDEAVAHLAQVADARDDERVRALVEQLASQDSSAGVRARALRIDLARRSAEPARLAAALVAGAGDVEAEDERSAMLVEAVEILDEACDAPHDALATGVAAVSDGLVSPALLDAVQAVAARAGEFLSFIDALVAAADRVRPEQEREVLARAATLAEASGDAARALDLRQRQVDGGDDAARQELEALLRAEGRQIEWLDSVEARTASLAPDARMRERLEALRSALGEGLPAGAAEDYLRRWVERGDDDADGLAAAAAIAAELGAWEVACTAWEAQAAAETDAAVARAALERAGRAALAQLRDAHRAADLLERAADGDASDDALAAWAAALDSLDRADALAAVVRRRADRAVEPERRAALLVQLADVHEYRRDDPRAAADAVEAAAGAAPDAELTLRLLRLLEQVEEWDRYADVPLASLADVDPEAFAEIAAARVRALATRLGRVDDAAAELLRVADAGQAVGSLAGEVAAAALDAGRPELARDVLEGAVERAVSPAERAELLTRLADVLRDALGEGSLADAMVRAAFEADPHNERAIAAMTMLASADGDEELLLQLNVLRLETAEGIARVPLLVERLRLAASLGRASEASALLCEVELAGCSPALLLDVADALVAAGRVDCVQRALAALDAAGGAPRAERGRAAFCRGWTLEQRGESEAARAAYREGQTTQPPSIPAMRALARLLGDEGEWAAALDVLLAALLHQATLEPGDRAELYYAIGIARLQTGDEPRAGEMFRRALALAPDHAGARAALDIDGGG